MTNAIITPEAVHALATSTQLVVAAPADKSRQPLHVIKIGSASFDAAPSLLDEVAAASRAGRRVLLVLGGGTSIAQQYEAEGRQMNWHTLANGDVARTATEDDIALLVRAYTTRVLPALRTGLLARGLRIFAEPAFTLRLVAATRNKPIKVLRDGRNVIVRDHLVGTPEHCDTALLQHLLERHDVVCLTAPVADSNSATPGGIVNTDADMLAAALAVALKADHIRFVTSTPGILRDVEDSASAVTDIFPGDDLPFVLGRMKQKIRAARHVLEGGIADVAITGPHSFARATHETRLWPIVPPDPRVRLLTQVVSINSVSTDEAEVVNWLIAYCAAHGVEAWGDGAGNFVARKGHGSRRLLLLGHLDTVPGPWRPKLNDAGHLSARGIVDAKGSLVNFVEALIAADVPAHGTLTVVGAVEEEVSSSKGAFHVRDTLSADAVVIGEPSRADTVTLGYYGLLKVRIAVAVPHSHSAGKGVVSAPDRLVDAVARLRSIGLQLDPEGISALISTRSWSDPMRQHAEAVLNFRVSPKANFADMTAAAQSPDHVDVSFEILRATPAHTSTRTCTLARCFVRALATRNVTPRFVVKKGTSDMNTLATTWTGVDMVAYGPGDSALDHTDHEFLTVDEYVAAREVLDLAIANWFVAQEAMA